MLRSKIVITFALTIFLQLISVNNGKSIEFEEVDENLQKLTFFSNSDYSGETESFTEAVLDIQGTDGVAKIAKSFCVEKGVWLIFGNVTFGPKGQVEKGDQDPDFDITNGMLVNSNLGMICVSLHDEETGQMAIYTMIRHLAGNDLESTSLSLYDGRWKGNETFVSGDGLRLPAPTPVTSFGFTANVPWTLTLTSGEEFCLPARANDPFEFGIAFAEFNQPMWVSSAKIGCSEELNSAKKFQELTMATDEVMVLYPEPPPGFVKFGILPEYD